MFIYQILWMRMLALLFGTTTTALALVIAVFMAGMGMGSLYFGHRADRTHHPVRMFALSSFCTALSALLVLIAIHSSSRLYITLRHLLKIQGNPLVLIIILSVILMIIPTFFMGAMLPILCRMYVSDQTQIGTGIGWLYAFTTLGNIIGALMTAYVLIPIWGHAWTYIIAMIINIATGAIVMVFPMMLHYKIVLAPRPPVKKNIPAKRRSALLLIIAGTTGFCALALEILWTRILRTYITNSTYSFTIVLVVYLLGVLVGSTIYFKRLYRKASPWLLGISQLVISIYTLVVLLMINQLPGVLFLLKNLLLIPFFRVVLPGITLSAILIFIPTVAMGIAFPLLCHLYTSRVERLGQGVGNVIFINTCGSIAGSICAAIILIPLAGITRGIGIIALITCINVLFAFLLAGPQVKFSRWTVPYIGAFISTLILVFFSMRQNMILPPTISRSALRADRILYYNETYDGTVVVTEDLRTGIRACYINNNAVCGTTYDALKVVKMLGHLPFLFNSKASRACIIGFGIGITTSTLAMHDLKTIDCVEICPGVAQATHFFTAYNHNILGKKTVHLFPGDGRIHLLTTQAPYDIISCDPTHPTLGCNNLYTQEYFELCKNRLAQGGVVCQYLPLHKLSLAEFKIAIRTFISVFPHTTIWLAHAHAVMVGSLHEQHLNFDAIVWTLESVNDNIIHDPYDLISSLILDEYAAQLFTGDGPLNTDDHPLLEFYSPASTMKDNWDRNLSEMLACRVDPTKIVHGVPDNDKLVQYLTAQRFFLKALIYKNQGQLKAMIKAMEMAYAINPTSEEIRFFLDHERSQLKTIQ